MSEHLKITCIIHSISLGGMERVMSLLINEFANHDNIEVSLLLIGKDRQVDFHIPESIKLYKPDFKFNPKQRTSATLKTINFTRKTIRQINPDTILCFGEIWNNLVLLALYGLSYPVFISDRMKPNNDLGKLHNLLRNKLYPKAAGFIAQTEKAGIMAKKNNWNTNIKVIGNPIPEVVDQPTVEKENIVLTVGRLIETKHIDQLIDIFQSCNKPDWKLVIVGGNANKLHLLEDYRALVKKRGLEDRVKLVGSQKNVEDYYHKSKIFAFTSSSEGFPNVVGEALSTGLPVVTYDCIAGPSDMIEHGKNGYLVPVFDRETFKEKLRYLMEHPQKRKQMGDFGRETIKKFSVKSTGKQVLNFIRPELSQE